MNLREFHQKFAIVIRNRREDLGITQVALGAQIGVSRASICYLEGGNKRFSFYKGLRLMHILGISVADICGNVEAMALEAASIEVRKLKKRREAKMEEVCLIEKKLKRLGYL